MFESLSGRLQSAFSKLRGKGRLSESDVNDAMREIRRALLEADVNHVVAKKFVDAVKERAIGQDILQSLTAGQQVVSIVNDELTRLLGETQAKLERSAKPPTVVMMVGLQGAGKTTATAKLGRFLATSEHRRPLLVAADIYRPAAIDQLVALGQQIGVAVWAPGAEVAPAEIVRTALDEARRGGYDYVLIDTAGRLHIDELLMNELDQLRQLSEPEEILLVVDAMTGQDAVTVAQSFHEALGITGVVLTKLDGDTRGGAALSVRHVTGCPIKFVGTGERPDALEPFYPDRMASRILGMGDVLTLIEKAQAHFDEDQAKVLEQKMRNNDFTLEDFLTQLQQVKKMGPLDQLMGMIPGLGGALKNLPQGGMDEKPLKRIEAIILSMSPEERAKPELVEKSSSRRVRIAKGSGTQVKDVNQLLRQFGEMRKMMKQFSAMGKGGKRSMANLKNRFGAPRMPFGGGRGKRSR